MNRHHTTDFIALLLIFSLLFGPVVLAEAPLTLTVMSSEDVLTATSMSVLSFQFAGQQAGMIRRVRLDASALGYEKLLSIDLELLAQTVGVIDTIEPGEKELTLLVYLEGEDEPHEYPVKVTVAAPPEDAFAFDEQIIYFVLTDRFHNGDTSNDDPHGAGYDPSHLESYHGGDFQGLIDKMPYLASLGVTLLWITPIVDNVDHDQRYGLAGSQYGYHGYWAKDFTALDEHLGDLETFHSLIDTAADYGIGIMVDVVLNHTGYGLKASDSREDIPNYPTADDRTRFAGMLREEPKPHTVTGELAGLPDFITENPAVREQIVAWQVAWIARSRTPNGNQIKGFRVDTVKHVDFTLWRSFKNKITEIAPDFPLLGEWYDATVDQDGGVLMGAGMDGLLDFGFKGLAQSFIRGDIEKTERLLTNRNAKISNLRQMGSFLSSHDEDGFLITRALNDRGSFKVAASLQLTAKGVPVIYYGEEIGQSGKAAGDMAKGEFNENRYDFAWSLANPETNDMLDHYQRLLRIRNAYQTVFAKGTRQTLLANDALGISVFLRSHEGESILVALNTTDQAVPIHLVFSEQDTVAISDLYREAVIEKTADAFLLTIPSKEEGGTAIVDVGRMMVDVSTVEP